MNGRCCALLVMAGLGASWPALGRAYSDPGRFGDPVLEGGGDNHWFTASPADGFSCNVCHSGREGLELSVRSVPASYLPGQTYEIVVAWADPLARVAANVEVTDELGRPIGTLSAPPTSALQPPDECEPKGQGIGASAVFTLPDGRQVLGFAACGASQVRWQWTAPPLPAGTAFLSGGLVVGNDDESLAGDGVTVFTRTILAPGQEPLDTRASGGCSVSPPATRRSPSGGWLLWVVAALGFGMRRLSTREDR